MRKFLFIALLIAFLIGCTTTAPYGNFANSPVEFDQKMADDTVKQLVVLYPPASTVFSLLQEVRDHYGLALINALRSKGYALLELKQEVTPTATEAPTPQSSSIDLHYLIDQPGSTNLYRITLMVGNQSLTRAYVTQNDMLVPAGYWIRKE